ncbi:cadherin repeat domain-containing protein [Hyunsoonleella flava]|uniref:Cadherin repeat domain-containing protein n=1 Tax=Hyunsoonleella flava TaxID=2527939 RepID=A0A4V2J9W5_9FLAO|nr:cadherin repeat domain-containing protein [Hyunsoonleella flava]TBN01315.1 cadherin repeat domain-containing protein [Hyunsoonleella flava]
MNSIKFFSLACAVMLFCACQKDDTPTNSAPVLEDRTMNMNENPTSDLVTTVTATDADDDQLTYTIVSQTPENSVGINTANGEIYIVNASAFDYEQNTTIIINIEVTDGVNTTASALTINILDVNENG